MNAIAMLSPPVKAEKCSIRAMVLAFAFSSTEAEVRMSSRRFVVCVGLLEGTIKAAS